MSKPKLHYYIHPRLFCLVALLLGVIPLASATNYYVNEASTAGDIYTTAVGNNANNGLTPSTPKANLTNIWNTYGPSGTNVLTSGDTVFIDAGTYYQTERDLHLTVPIVVKGAGMTKTIFDNDDAGISGYNCFIIGAGVHLEGFKIWRYGRQNTYAHAIHVEAGVTGVQISYVHIDDCGRDSGLYPIEILSGAEVDFIGGGVTCNQWLQSGGIHIDGNTTSVDFISYLFYENSRGYDNGAALNITNGTVTIRNSLFEGNQCNNGGESILYMNNGDLKIYDTEFLNNRYLYSNFNEYGGTILVNGGSFYMTRSRVTGLSKIGGTFAYGAGACFDGTTAAITAQIDSCYFASNTGSRGNDIHSKRANTTVNIFETTLGSASQQVGTSTSGTINLTNCGNPGVYTNTGVTNKINTIVPSYTATPDIPQYTGTCGAVVILPVTLISFEVNCIDNQTVFEWYTASEKNNSHFEIWYSADGKIWNSVHSVPSKGDSETIQHYGLVSTQEESGYYMLQQTDFDGRTSYFAPLWFESCSYTSSPEIRGHFSHDGTLILFGEFDFNELYTVTLIDGQGKLLSTISKRAQGGQLEIQFQTLQLSSGMYFFNVSGTRLNSNGKTMLHR